MNDIQIEYPTFRKITKYVANKMRDGYTVNPYTALAKLVPGITAHDVVQFHQQRIAGNQNRVWIVIGDKKLTDMKALARFGKVVELKKEEIYR
jgi:hypothetical protein